MHDWYIRTVRLRFEVFTGVPYVHVSPREWGIAPADVRGIARGRGYLEIAPMYPGCSSFQYAPQHVPPVPLFDGPDRPDKNRERWLRNHLDGSDRVWISLRHANLSARRVAEVAETEGLRVAADFSDQSDRILLLGRDPAPPRLPLPSPTGGRFRPVWLNGIAPVAIAVLFVVAALAVGASDEFENPLANLLFLAAFVGAVPAAFTTGLFPRTSRLGWLAREFDGKSRVDVPMRAYQVSPDLVVQIAGYHGYALHALTTTRAGGQILKFAKRV